MNTIDYLAGPVFSDDYIFFLVSIYIFAPIAILVAIGFAIHRFVNRKNLPSMGIKVVEKEKKSAKTIQTFINIVPPLLSSFYYPNIVLVLIVLLASIAAGMIFYKLATRDLI